MDNNSTPKTEKERFVSLVRDLPSTITSSDLKVYAFDIFIGSGSFAKCFRIEEKSTGKVYACKVMSRKIVSSNYGHFVTNEIEIHRRLKHRHIVRFIDCFMVGQYIYIIQSYCENRSLKELLRERDITDGECKHIMAQLFHGIEYMHRKHVIHRDLKPGNILLDGDNLVKIADFGLAIESTDEVERHHLCGTTSYLAPEVFRNKGFSFASDIWAAGVVMYYLVAGEPPFCGNNDGEIVASIEKINYIVPDDPDCRFMLSQIFVKRPKDRPDAEKCLQFEYIENRPDMPQFAYERSESTHTRTVKEFESFDLKVIKQLAHISQSEVTLPDIKPHHSAEMKHPDEYIVSTNVIRRLYDRLCSIYDSLNFATDAKDPDKLPDELPNEKQFQPWHWIVKWTYDIGMVDGFAYKLLNGTCGILFHDGLRMRQNINGEYLVLEFGDERMKRFSDDRTDLLTRQQIFEPFIERLEKNSPPIPEDSVDGGRTPSVQFWCHTDEAMIILLSNHSIQINFQKNRQKYLIDPNTETITKIRARGESHDNTIQFMTLVAKQYPVVDESTYKYIISVARFLTHHLGATQ